MSVSTFSFLGLLFLAQILGIDGGGIVQLRLRNFTNTQGTVYKSNGMRTKACCDNPKPIGTNIQLNCDPTLCDPVIDICISERGPQQLRPCNGMHVRLPTYLDTDVIDFNDLVKEFNFTYWGGALYVLVTVSDDGTTFDKMVDLDGDVFSSTPVMYGETAWLPLTLSEEGVSISMDINIKCQRQFRNMHCDCKDIDTPTTHTMCDRRGNRVCLKGWANLPQCLTPTVDCQFTNPCKNNASCGTYTNKTSNDVVTVCTCPLDFSGRYCETYTGKSTTPLPTTTTTTTPIPTTIITKTNKTTDTATTATVTITTDAVTTEAVTTEAVTTDAVTTDAATTAPRTAATTNQKAASTVKTTTTTKTATSNQGTRQTPSKTTTTRQVPNGPGPITTISTNSNNPTNPNAGNGTKSSDEGSSGGSNTGVIGGAAGGGLVLAGAALALFLLRKRIFKTCQNNKVSDSSKGDAAKENEAQPEKADKGDNPSDEAKDKGDNPNDDVKEEV